MNAEAEADIKATTSRLSELLGMLLKGQLLRADEKQEVERLVEEVWEREAGRGKMWEFRLALSILGPVAYLACDNPPTPRRR